MHFDSYSHMSVVLNEGLVKSGNRYITSLYAAEINILI